MKINSFENYSGQNELKMQLLDFRYYVVLGLTTWEHVLSLLIQKYSCHFSCILRVSLLTFDVSLICSIREKIACFTKS